MTLSEKKKRICNLRPDFRVTRASQSIGFHKKLVYLTARWTGPDDEKHEQSRSCATATIPQREDELLDQCLFQIQAGDG